jgi:hypothetical protein
MRLLLLAATLALVACKPDPIEACVAAEKRSYLRQACENVDGTGCSRDLRENLIAINEPSWRKKCMRQAVGKDD